ncbi:putative glucosamine-6-phosphate isomerase, putative,glucosamine-6-phosphate deaminase [Trypanosoma conorhini]|uniref:Putative glucosamine-6-phosphate isomerase, putative,glucosamine-6-phosphate deaminase n=1 Tax=Trypanosoma conorhini TaxID=83891 RepID=A0A422PQW4_9TRYP|nr:putative glucosamine-6-phosphate isomerase, putative,glucosamine-6-phosphate deaminase [Trypanosoma conorhini]RNF20139.1 putative glucosamine-6-phosphate isomerase, putative,glucosamine-6-phosphate deaminase [Trypanosoma conorhini]
MIRYLTLAELPRREKEKVMLLLAAAENTEWRPVHDPHHRFCVEWQVSSSHPALSFLSLRQLRSVQKGPSPSLRGLSSGRNRREDGPPSVLRAAARAQGRSFVQKEFPHASGVGAEDISPLTIDWNNDSASVVDPTPSSSLSYSFLHTLSPSTAQQPRRRVGAVSCTSAKACRSRSQGSVERTPFVKARSTFLRRQFTPQRSISAPRTGSLGRQGLLGNSGKRQGEPTAVPGPNASTTTKPTPATPLRSAQWVSRLVEDIMSYVAKMNAVDHQQVRSVASLTVRVLKARYGALQWNRVLKELAEGLQRYHDVSSLCRVFRELFLDESDAALEDFCLFSRLHRAAMKYGTVETQKVSLPLEEADSSASRSLIQSTIVLRRYVELRLLTSVLNDMLAAVTLTDRKDIDSFTVMRRRKLKPAEVVGVKTIVAYWVEEESCKPESLAFDLGGFVDLHEVLAVVVAALGSVRRRSPVRGGLSAPRKTRCDECNDEPQGSFTAPREGSAIEHVHRFAYAEQARLIMQVRASEATSPVSLTSATPAAAAETPDPVRPSARGSHAASAMRREVPVCVPATERHGPRGERQEVHQEMPEGLDKASSAKEVSHVCAAANRSGDANGLRDSTPPPDAVVPPPPPTPRRVPGEPLVVDLDHRPPPSANTKAPPRLTRAAATSKCEMGANKTEEGTQPQQYFAALAAIDAELQRRREVLKSTVAFGPTARDTPCDLRSPTQSSATDLPCHAEETATQTSDAEFTPGHHETGTRESAWEAEATRLEEQLGPSQPPAHTSTFGDLVSPPLAVQPTPSSILLPSKHRPLERLQGRSDEGEEDRVTRDDLAMLTPEEQHLLADLRRALNRKK